MESGKLDIVIGKGPSARTIQLLIFHHLLSLVQQHEYHFHPSSFSILRAVCTDFQFYTEDEIATIVKKQCEDFGYNYSTWCSIWNSKALGLLRVLQTTYLKRARDYAQVHKAIIDKEVVDTSLALLEIDEFGLGVSERLVLDAIVNTFNGGPVGLNTIAAATGEEEATIEDVTEPYLIQIGMLERTPRGRKATEKAMTRF